MKIKLRFTLFYFAFHSVCTIFVPSKKMLKVKKHITSVLFTVIATSLVVIILTGCSASRLIPDDSYMLDKVKITTDTKEVKADMLNPYIRQKGNSKWFSLFKIPLGTYAMSGQDTTKWINRKLRAIGEDPVLFDSTLARRTCGDLEAALQNMGYIRAKAAYTLEHRRKKKVNVLYGVTVGPHFMLGSVRYDIQDSNIKTLLEDQPLSRSVLKTGQPFNTSDLEAERKRITTLLNNNGYFRFNKDFITYTADTVRKCTDIALTLHLHKYKANDNDTPENHRQYTIGKVVFTPGGGESKLPLRQSVLEENTPIEEGRLFNSAELQRTYNNFGRMQIVRYTGVKFTERQGSDTLDCNISLSSNKINSISFQPEGTNTAGDLGAAASLTYENKNIFRGAETFSIKLRGAFEAITGLEGYQNQDYEEYSLEARLAFPRFLVPFVSKSYRRRSTASSELSVSYNMQNRPEFHRRVFSAGWRYRWSNSRKNKQFKVDVLDLNYIYMPWISPTFKKEYLDDVSSRNSILRYNYEDLFIMKFGVGMSVSHRNEAIKANIETAGNLLNAISSAAGAKKNADGSYTLFNIAYAQYVKGDIDYTRLLPIDTRNNLALHVGLGVAWPYGNSRILPFEKRYFSGGANSVRGWSVRGLGPGRFRGTDGSIDFINQTGDLKLDLNAELRSFLFWKFYGAVFIDAGNIWTLREYKEQPGGQFKFNEFYKQIAVAYGLGLRLNFDFFILRFDMGMKAINPAYTTKQEHYAIVHPDFSRDFAFHFAVGLPF